MPNRQVQCKQCLATASVPDGIDPHTMTWCSCCTQDHHHGQAAENCPGNNALGHPGAPCSHPNPRACTVVSQPVPLPDGSEPPPDIAGVRPAGEDCPGGHCGAGVPGCTVCRPIIHFATAGPLRF